MPVNDKTPQWRHQLTLVDREEMTVEGVMSLGSADEDSEGLRQTLRWYLDNEVWWRPLIK